MRAIVVVALLFFAGCASDPVEEKPVGPKVEVTDDTGAICGVVVDASIVPVVDAVATIIVDGEEMQETSDDEGIFCFGPLDPGFYDMSVTKTGYTEATLQAEAKAGVEEPPLVKLQIDRLFDQDPFVVPFKFEGRLACHIQAGLTAPCVTDWTQLVPGCGSGCAPELRTIMGDARDFIYEVESGWQAHIVEMHWEQSSQATSSEMGLIMRDFEVGGGSHQFGEMEGASPLWIRFDVNQVHPTQGGGDPTMIPSEGYDQIIHFAGVRTADGDQAAAAIEQEFEVFVNTFYYGAPDGDWSFIEGDEPPF